MYLIFIYIQTNNRPTRFNIRLLKLELTTRLYNSTGVNPGQDHACFGHGQITVGNVGTNIPHTHNNADSNTRVTYMYMSVFCEVDYCRKHTISMCVCIE